MSVVVIVVVVVVVVNKSSPGFKALPIIRFSGAFNMLFLEQKFFENRPTGRLPSGAISKNTKNAITLSFFNRFGLNLAQIDLRVGHRDAMSPEYYGTVCGVCGATYGALAFRRHCVTISHLKIYL